MINLILNHNCCEEELLEKFLEVSRNFSGIELSYKKIAEFLVGNKNIKILAELINTYKLKVVSVYSLNDFNLSIDVDYQKKILVEFKRMMEICYKLECDLIIATPSHLSSEQEKKSVPRWRIINRTRERLLHLSKLAVKEDIKLGLEFESHPTSSISTLKDSKEVIGSLEAMENVGYIIDTFSIATSHVELDELKDIKARIYLIRLSDLKSRLKESDPIEAESTRLFPGTGDFDFKNFFKVTNKIGYRDYYSLTLSQDNCKENLKSKFFEMFKNV